MQDLSGDETWVFRHQERESIGSVGGSTRSLYRLHGHDKFYNLVNGRTARRSSRDKTFRFYDGRCDRINPNARLTEIICERPNKCVDTTVAVP